MPNIFEGMKRHDATLTLRSMQFLTLSTLHSTSMPPRKYTALVGRVAPVKSLFVLCACRVGEDVRFDTCRLSVEGLFWQGLDERTGGGGRVLLLTEGTWSESLDCFGFRATFFQLCSVAECTPDSAVAVPAGVPFCVFFWTASGET